MSHYIHIIVEHRDDNNWNELNFYNKGGEKLDIFDNSFRDILLGENNISTHRGFPNDFNRDKIEDYELYIHTSTWYDYCELLALSNTPYHEYDIEEQCNCMLNLKANPLKELVSVINAMLEAYEIYFPKPGDVRIVCYVD